jgi:hypothetical protein
VIPGIPIITLVKVGALLLAVGAFAWLVDDYAHKRHELEAAEARIATLEYALLANEAMIRKIVAQRAADEAVTRRELDAMAAVAAGLEAQLNAVAETPDDPSCPVAAPISRALDLLRQP